MSTNGVGAVVITSAGINAMAEAQSTGKNIKPKYYRCSDIDYVLDPTRTYLSGWRTHDIDLFHIMDHNSVEFVCDVPANEATKYTRTVGIYLDDNTLFAVAKPPYPFPPLLRQTLKIQVVYQDTTDLMDFKYIQTDQTEQDASQLNSTVVLGNQITKNTLLQVGIKIQGWN